ncbi:FecR family protein [Pedobacter alluvionis]|uniref:FecR family protein n=1 Tax=Pedobacter alluvionis TaxID=475253 RepID=A0A497XTK1_9SPHI|nr:FecR family protein [Pedobacter alluvionis]RLJ72760.1 FecR family protein [Pedobacter alluvionis]TFB29397.1 FecR family protein [Pedobacter alluvionis]
MKPSEQLHILFKKHLDNTCSPEETQHLMNYFQLDEDQEVLKELIIGALAIQDEHYENDLAIAGVLEKVDQDLFVQIQESAHAVPEGKSKILKLWIKIVAVAAVLAVVYLGVYFFNNQPEKVASVPKVTLYDIKSGGYGATLTLANGRKVSLANASKGEIGRESGIIITKSDDGELVYQVSENISDPNATNTLSTARGETYQVRLPDGSLVYLNAASSLTYTTSLIQNGKRIVTLSGEGYFEVAKDKQHPFIVKTGRQEVEVLGTHFNISSYADDEVEKTTLLEGSVKLSASGNYKLLRPGQQAKLSAGKITISETDTDLAVAWKNNEFVIESENIETIMKMISRWYNLEVVYLGEKTTQRFSGQVSRFDKLSKVLEIVESTGEARFDLKGRTVYVSK